MSDQQARRLAANEALFREINEAITRGRWAGEGNASERFCCECAGADCSEIVRMEPREYERVRANARRFILCPGHEDPAIETVIERTPVYVVVEKRGAAAREVEATDPRA
jgi:hypothetical protein